MGNKTTIRALVRAAYEEGWRDASDDSLEQQNNPSYPYGKRKRHHVNAVLASLDPQDLLGLRMKDEA